jgi:hypothetical protein
MARDLAMCPHCGRRVYVEAPTPGRRALERAVEVNVYPRGHDAELAPDLRLNDELDLSL